MKNNIKALRHEAGLSLEALANACGCTGSNIHLLEHGRKAPRLDTAYAIAAVLGRSVTEVWPDETEVIEETVTVRRGRSKGAV